MRTAVLDFLVLVFEAIITRETCKMTAKVMSDIRQTVLGLLLYRKRARADFLKVTGCSAGGIGEQLAREFNNKGLRVFATARNASNIQNLADVGIETLSLEVHKPESIKRLKEEIGARTGGKLDMLVNNAGKSELSICC